jgi:tRNA threonylcarbamoyladenosine biosynthesis protein TsaE
MKDVITHSEAETAEFSAKFAKTVANGSVIALHGSLGAGKTVFSRGFARGCGILDHIPSPTFTIVQEYEIKINENVKHNSINNQNIKLDNYTQNTQKDISNKNALVHNRNKRWLFHMDLYRIADSDAALAFGIDEYLYDNNAVKLIEWSDRIADLLPENTLNVYIDHIDETSRKIRFH